MSTVTEGEPDPSRTTETKRVPEGLWPAVYETGGVVVVWRAWSAHGARPPSSVVYIRAAEDGRPPGGGGESLLQSPRSSRVRDDRRSPLKVIPGELSRR